MRSIPTTPPPEAVTGQHRTLAPVSVKRLPMPPDFAAFADLNASYQDRLIHGSNLPNPHVHEVLEIGLVHEGNGTLFAGEKSLKFKQGDITVIAPGEPHIAYYTGPAVCTWLYFDLIKLSLVPLDHPLLSETGKLKGPGFLNVFSAQRYPLIASPAEGLVREFTEKRCHYREAIRGHLLDLLAQLQRLREEGDRHFAGIDAAGPVHLESPLAKIFPAITYIHERFGSEISIEDLAKTVCMSPTNFRRTFHRLLGVSPHAYLMGYRLSRASQAMKTTDMSVEAIAFECGFSAISAFRRAFKQMTGKSPAAWRRNTPALRNSDAPGHSE